MINKILLSVFLLATLIVLNGCHQVPEPANAMMVRVVGDHPSSVRDITADTEKKNSGGGVKSNPATKACASHCGVMHHSEKKPSGTTTPVKKSSSTEKKHAQ
jgi:hypothetical protein